MEEDVIKTHLSSAMALINFYRTHWFYFIFYRTPLIESHKNQQTSESDRNSIKDTALGGCKTHMRASLLLAYMSTMHT